MKILIDMNLSPDWVEVFGSAQLAAVHWSSGRPESKRSRDSAVGISQQLLVFTHDLDFGAILAATQAESPSVVQVRAQDVLPSSIGSLVVNVFRQFESILEAGALVTVDPSQTRVRVLPIRKT